jgi:hypothetical protein
VLRPCAAGDGADILWRQFEHSRTVDGEEERLVVSAFFHTGDESPHFISKLAEAARAASAEGGAVGVEGLDVEEVAFPRIAQEVLMQTEMPLEVQSHLTHKDNSPHPKATYRGRDGYEQRDSAVPNYRAYYYYHGSSTRPPCAQNVDWVLLKHSLAVSGEDLKALMSLTGRNARPVQVWLVCLAPRRMARAASALLLVQPQRSACKG